MMYVIFKELGTYKMTTIENYEASVRNERTVVKFNDCNSFADCLNCLPKYEGIFIIDKTGD